MRKAFVTGDSRQMDRRSTTSRRVRPRLEELEDRTVFSVGSGLNSVFDALQQALNGHLWQPSVSYSLPLVGDNLGADPQSQFLAAVGTAVKNVTETTQLQAAIPANGGSVDVSAPAGSQKDYEIVISGGNLTLTEAFNPGLPGLTAAANPLTTAIKDLTSTLKVDVGLTYTLHLFFALDQSGNVTLDTTQNSATVPLLSMMLTAHLDSSSLTNLTEPLGPLTVDVTDDGSGFNAAMRFNVTAGSYPAASIDVAGSSSSVTFQSAPATIGLGFGVDGTADSGFPGLETDLTVNWNLSNTTNPFDAIANDPTQPTLGFAVSLDLSSVGTWLNSTILGALAQKLQALAPTITTIDNVLTTQIPIVGSIIPNGSTLEDILENYTSAGSGAGSQIASFLNTLDAIVNGTETLTQFTGGQIPLASVQLPDPANDDPRLAGFALAPLLDGISPPNPSQQAQNFLNGLNLPGKFQLPLLSDPMADLQFLLLDSNQVLVQWQLPSLNLSANTTIGPFPIFPPLALAITLGFGLEGGLTIGYDTYGFTSTTPTALGWNQDPTNAGSISNIAEGVFVQNAQLALTGSIGLDAEADLGVAQIGGGGSFNLSFGIQGINDSGTGAVDLTGPPPGPTLGTMSYPYHTPDFNGSPESVLQWGDIKYDGYDGPLCPFQVGGNLSIGLSVFITLGISPFSITYTDNLGSITIANFSVNTCQGNAAPILADSDTTGDNIGQLLSGQGLPTTADIDDQLEQEDPSYTGTQHWLLLDLGSFASQRNVENNPSYPPQSESFEVTPDRNKTGLLVQAFGQQEDFPNLNAATTTILAFGASNSTVPVNITVDQGVHANAYLVGGLAENHFNYEGDGDVYMKGGMGNNTLVGGSRINELVGGDGDDDNPADDVLVGGTGHNILRGGLAAATLVAGPKNGDLLTGGGGDSTYVFNAGAGSDTLTGGGGGGAINQFQWQEGDGNVTVTGGEYGTTNDLDVLGKQGGETWNISQNAEGQIDIPAPSVGASAGKTILAEDVQVLSVDSTDANNDGGDTYIVGDLSYNGVQDVNLNLHEQANPDDAPDHVIVDAPTTPDTVNMFWDDQQAGQNQQQTTVMAPLSHIQISTSYAVGAAPSTYEINTAIPKPTDTLQVTTGPGADTVTIGSTQPDIQPPKAGGKVTVDTGAGNDTIDVGEGQGGNTLDNVLGPLTVDAGTGRNSITFDESSSYVHDTVALTATQLIRYTQPPSVTITSALRGPITETAYPFVINYRATGGDFADGVNFDTSYGGTNLYIPETGANAPTTVTADGGYSNAEDTISVGYNGASPAGQTSFPTTPATSTLALLRSPLLVNGVNGNSSSFTNLNVDDEAASAGETYTLGTLAQIFTNPPVTFGTLQRSGVAGIDYTGLGLALDLNGGSLGNTVNVTGVLTGTTASLNSGGGNDTITVANSVKDLDDIGGVLTVNGGGGTNSLIVEDTGDGYGEDYQLTASQIYRDANQESIPAITINFFHMSQVKFDASNNTAVDTIEVGGSPAGVPVTILPGNGTDFLEVDDLDDIKGALLFAWGGGTEMLAVSDQTASAANTYNVTSTAGSQAVLPLTTLKRTGAALVSVSGALNSLELATGELQKNVVNVNSIAAGTAASIFTGQMSNTVNVSPALNLNKIAGPLSVFGNGPTQLYLNDQNAAAGRSYTLTSSGLQFSPTLPAVQFTGVTGVTLNATASAGVNVQGSALGSAVQIDLGTGSNHVAVGSAGDTLASIQGAVTVHGQTGSDPLVLNGQTDPAQTAYAVTANSIASLSSIFAPITFANMGSVALNTGAGEESVAVTGVPAVTPVTLNGQGSGNTLYGPAKANVWKVSAANAGSLDSLIHFNLFQNLTGGSLSDDFEFQNLATIAGAIDGTPTGGGGVETLDFTGYVPNNQTGTVGVTLLESGHTHGLLGGAGYTTGNTTTPIIGGGFNNIDTLIGGGTGATLNGTSFIGGISTNVAITGFAPFSLSVPSTFSGNLHAPGETIQSLVTGTLSGSVTAATLSNVVLNGDFTGQLFVNTSFGTLTVLGTQAASSHVWLKQDGSFQVVNGAMVGLGAANLATLEGVSEANATIAADVTDAAGQTAGIIARANASATSYYLAGITSVGSGYQVNIWLVQNGTMTALAAAKSIASASATLQFQLSGSTLKLLVNGVATITATNNVLSTGGIGVSGGAGAAFSDFTDQ